MNFHPKLRSRLEDGTNSSGECDRELTCSCLSEQNELVLRPVRLVLLINSITTKKKINKLQGKQQPRKTQNFLLLLPSQNLLVSGIAEGINNALWNEEVKINQLPPVAYCYNPSYL
jgi:hypothetical protein